MSTPIRVLHVVTHMNRGGLETMIMNYYRNIDREKVQFDFLTHRPEGERKNYDDEIESFGGHIYHIQRLNPFSLSYRRQLRRFFKAHPEYEIIHVHQDCLSGIILKEAKKCGIKNRIAHCHSSNQDKDFKYIIKCFYRRMIKKYATDLFACGIKAGKWMFMTDDFTVLPNAIDVSKYSYNSETHVNKRIELGLSEKDYVLIHVGRFCKVKNHQFLVELFDQLLKVEENAKLVLVGSGPDFDSIKTLVNQKLLDGKILFLGLRTDVDELLQAADVMVMPSRYEGVPLSVIEAQASDLPCVLSTGIPEDCVLTTNVLRIDLERSIDYWINVICGLKNKKRMITEKELSEKGYSISENSKKLEAFYLEKNREKE